MTLVFIQCSRPVNYVDLTYIKELFSSIYHAGSNLFEAFQTMHGQFGDLPASKISELMKLDSFEVTSLSFPLP